jgi:hypothetical protein
MKLEVTVQQRTERTKRPKLKRQTHCPKCKSKDLLTQGPDQFCCDCDWDTCFEYVEMGLMNNLEAAAREHYAGLSQKKSQQTSEQQPPQKELNASA